MQSSGSSSRAWLRRALRAVQVVPKALYKGGGLTGMVLRILEIFRDSGFSGVGRSLGILLRGEGPPRAQERADYAPWIDRYDAMTPNRRDEVRQHIERMNHLVRFSVFISVRSKDGASWRGAAASVCRQLYPHWSLYLICEASEAESMKAITEMADSDPRILAGVVGAADGQLLKPALATLDGNWAIFLSPHDLLAEHALFWWADALNRQPELKLIYADEDMIDAQGVRSAPHFKPDWNPDLLRSQYYLGNAVAFDTGLLRDLCVCSHEMGGTRAYDTALRCSELLASSEVHHIPRLLLHRSSAAIDTLSQAGVEQVLTAHLKRAGVQGHVTRVPCGHRVHYALPVPAPLVSLVIPTRNAAALVRTCIESIQRLTVYANYEILLIDNGSDDPEALTYFRELETQPAIRVIRDDREFNYAALNNAAVAQAKGELVGLINNDVEIISEDWLSEMVGIALQPGVGAVGARLWYPDHTLQHGGVVLAGSKGIAAHLHRGLPAGEPGYFGRAVLTQTLSAVTAACLIVRTSTYRALGGLDEVNLKVAFNDVDFCLRLREAGYRNVWTPYAELFHYESATRGEDLSPEKKARFDSEVAYMARRWGVALDSDPNYNPNLTLYFDDFSFAWPPRLSVLD